MLEAERDPATLPFSRRNVDQNVPMMESAAGAGGLAGAARMLGIGRQKWEKEKWNAGGGYNKPTGKSDPNFAGWNAGSGIAMANRPNAAPVSGWAAGLYRWGKQVFPTCTSLRLWSIITMVVVDYRWEKD